MEVCRISVRAGGSGTLRILHIVTNADLGGAPRVVTELANRAVRDGHICAAASVPDGPFWEHLDPRVERLPLSHLRRELDPVQDPAAVIELVRLFKRWKPDIIHLHSSKASALGRFAALFASLPAARRIPTIYTIHGFDTILKTHRKFLPMERVLACYTSAIVPVSAYDQKNLREAGVRGNIRLIHNGASDRLGEVANPVVAARIAAARAHGAVIVLSIARLEPPKRFDLFLDVARSFASADPVAAAKVAFFWIGNVQPVDQAGLPPNVEMLGEVPEAGNCINLCDIFLLLSAYEGLPMSVLEALSCAKPVVASNVGGLAEAVGTDGKAGVLVPNDVDAVVKALSRLAVDPALRTAMGRAARKRYEAGFSAETMWRAYLTLYQNLYEASRGVI